jgi:hypothetical protein
MDLTPRPKAVITVNGSLSGMAPYTVWIDSSASFGGKPGLIVTWSSTNIAILDTTANNITVTFTAMATYVVTLLVRDPDTNVVGQTYVWLDIDGSSSVLARIISPASGYTWSVGETIRLVARSMGTLAQYTWDLYLHHCPGGGACHQHYFTRLYGRAATFVTPDHDYYAYLDIRLTVTVGDTSALANMQLYPRVASAEVASYPISTSASLAGYDGMFTSITQLIQPYT